MSRICELLMEDCENEESAGLLNRGPGNPGEGANPSSSAILAEARAEWELAKNQSISGVYFWAMKWVDTLLAESSNGRIEASEASDVGSKPASAAILP